LTNNEQ